MDFWGNMDMFGFLRRRKVPFKRQSGSSSYYDYQEDRLVQDDRLERNAQEVLKEPATDSFVVSVADEETAEMLQREFFSAPETEK